MFAIVCAPRTGSTHLAALLDGHPSARCFLEPFHESGAYLGIFRRDDPLTQKIHRGAVLKLREANTEAYLRFLETVGDGRYVATLGGGRNEIGFKILRGQDPAAMDFVVACRTIKKIVQHRDNVLATYLSLERAQQTKQWNLKVDEEMEFAAPVTFRAADFAEFRRIYDEFYAGVVAGLEATGQRYLPVKYTALDLATLNACAAFLDLPPVAALPQSMYRKQYNSDILAGFANAAEVTAWLREHGQEHWVREE